jgi:hypothetical protein
MTRIPTPLTIGARNVNDAFQLAHLHYLQFQQGQTPWAFHRNAEHRNIAALGPVVQAVHPVLTVYDRPDECVLTHPTRNANPFFHLLEALWMLDGGNDVALPAYMVPRMRTYSDDGAVFWGAYGHRWREWFQHDQILTALDELERDPLSRRVIIGMWDPSVDPLQGPTAKDLPCNLMMKVEIDPVYHRVNGTVYNRSNDVIWGCYGANAVQFSILLQFIAGALRRQVGWLAQFSANWHVYEGTSNLFGRISEHEQPYGNAHPQYITPLPLFSGMTGESRGARFLAEVNRLLEFVRVQHIPFVEAAVPGYEAVLPSATHYTRTFGTAPADVPFVALVAAPMADALCGVRLFLEHGDATHLYSAYAIVRNALQSVPHNDWLTAGARWLERLGQRRGENLYGHFDQQA